MSVHILVESELCVCVCVQYVCMHYVVITQGVMVTFTASVAVADPMQHVY